MQYSKFDFIAISMKTLTDTQMPVRKHTKRGYKLEQKPRNNSSDHFLKNKHRDYLFRIYKRSKHLEDFER